MDLKTQLVWSKEEIRDIYHKPLLELVHQAADVHRKHHEPGKMDRCALLSVKTGACSEDCAYCPQSSRYSTGVVSHHLLDLKSVLERAKRAVDMGADQFCLSTSGREVKSEKDFELLLEMISKISAFGIHVCSTLGSLSEKKALLLKNAGIYAYNHNIDTSPNFYKKIITTRTFDDRIKTLEILKKVNIRICSGGILGMGEGDEDRIDFLLALASMDPQPYSVPLNALIPIQGTPLEKMQKIPIWELLRVIATARIIMPKTILRLAGGRSHFLPIEQTLCFFAGIGSIHVGEKLLVTPNCSLQEDERLLSLLLEQKRGDFSLNNQPSF